MFDPSVFMSAFEAHGLATRAFRLDMLDSVGFTVGFMRPELDILGGEVQTAEIRIEYATADAPTLATGESLLIKTSSGDERYRVRNNPKPDGDGTFTRAELERQVL